MLPTPFFSICIPAYKRAAYLKRLFDSIAAQSWKDFEVILTDDSPDDSVQSLCLEYADRLPIRAFRNTPALGTPENWNEAIRHAKGEWIKLMHDDDWFAGNDSLSAFASAIREHPGASFIYSAYRNVHPDGTGKDIFAPAARRKAILQDPRVLFAGNVIGPPSCTVYKRKEGILYDKRLRWLVDIDFYIQYLQEGSISYLPRTLVHIGIGDQQVTASSFRNPRIEIPESFLLLEKMGTDSLHQGRIFDAWWRLLRNLRVRDIATIRQSGYDGPVPQAIRSMIRLQRRLPARLLRLGIFSKMIMAIACMRNRSAMWTTMLTAAIMLIGTILPGTARAQEYSYVHYDVRDGLAGSTVYSMVQDKDGFMWFGTEAGLSRFDGTQFKTFTTADGLPDNEIIKVEVDPKGRVWIMPFKNSIAYYWKGKIHNQQNDSLLHRLDIRGEVRHVMTNNAGDLLICESNGLLEVDTSGRIVRIDDIQGHGFDLVLSKPDIKGHFMFDLFCLLRFNYGMLSGDSIKLIGPSAAIGTGYSSYYSFGSLEVHVTAATFILYDREKDSSLLDIPSPRGIMNVSRLTDSTMSVNTAKGAFELNVRQKKFTDSFMVGKPVSDVVTDSEGDIWFSTMNDGIYRMVTTGFVGYRFGDAGNDLPVFSIHRIGSTLYMGSEHFFLMSMSADGKHLRKWVTCPGQTRGRIVTMLPDPKGIILGTDDGLVLWNNGKIVTRTRKELSIKAIVRENDSTLLVSSSRSTELYWLRDFALKESILVNMRSTCVCKKDDLYYIGTLDGLVVVKPNEWTDHVGERIKPLSNRVTDIRQSRDGTLWITTNGAGLVGYKDGRMIANIREKDGLTSDLCQNLFVAGDDLWVGTDKGLNRISRAGTNKQQILTVTSLDGLNSNIINAILVEGRKVFAGTTRGMMVFDADKIVRRSICNLRVTGIAISGKEWAVDTTGFILPHKQNDVQFDFVGISYKSGGNILYRYRLLGLDDSWKTTTRTSLNYLSLPSGIYTLELQAVNKFGVESQTIRIGFAIDKLFWERNGFRAFVLLLLIGIIWVTFSLRVRAIRRKEKERSDAVSRMAELEQMALRSQMNPHFIFNVLNSIQQYVLDRDIFNVNEFITRFSRLIRQTLDFSSRPRITLREEVEYLGTYLELEKTRFEDRFVYEIGVPGDLLDQDLYLPPMILQPYVENAVRHGMGLRKDKNGKITINMALKDGYLACSVEDNGVGRQAAAMAKSRNAIQYQSQGMKLTEKRIEMFNQVNGTPLQIRVEDLEDQYRRPAGTRITVFYPCGHDKEP